MNDKHSKAPDQVATKVAVDEQKRQLLLGNKADGKPVHRKPSTFALPVVQSNPFAAPSTNGHDDEGVVYWRSMAEKQDTEEYRKRIEREFPETIGEMASLDPVSRRSFLQVIGASMALAGAACTFRPTEKIVAYTRTPPNVHPGVAQHYATASHFGGYGTGLLVTTWDGRPTKVEGNPDHPTSQGASGTLDQANILSLYDPHRARGIRHREEGKSWRGFLSAVNEWTPLWAKDSGAQVRFLVEPNASPLLQDLRSRIQQRFPASKFYAHSPLARDNHYEGTKAAFGRPLEARYDLSKANVVVSLDADFLEPVGENLRHAREWSGRRVMGQKMNRVYVVEPHLSITGMSADHRARMRPSEVSNFARALVAELRNKGVANMPDAGAAKLDEKHNALVQTVAADLQAAAGAGLVIAGDRQPAWVHALAHAINTGLGASGNTVSYVDVGISDVTSGPSALKALAAEIDAGTVQTLVITAYNPAYSAPGELNFAAKLEKVPNVIYLSQFEDETAPKANWFLNAAHTFETWGDVRALDGTVSVIQPLTQPLFGGVSEAELYAALIGEGDLSSHQLVKNLWKSRTGAAATFDRTFEQWLGEGVVANTKLPPLNVTADAAGIANAMTSGGANNEFTGFEVSFARDYKAWDGRFSNNAWMQELPDPVSKLCWDNVAYVSPATAAKLNLRSSRYEHEMATEVDVCTLEYGGLKMEVAVLPMPGHADDCVTLPFGYGRTGEGEKVAKGIGFNAYLVRKADHPWFDAGATLTKTDKHHDLAITQEHWSMEGRTIVVSTPVGQFEKHLEMLVDNRGGSALARPEKSNPPKTLIPPVEYDKRADDQTSLKPYEYAWGMSIDLSRCTGCSACVLACQAENNIPTVGKENVKKSREMHWLRIDRYFTGTENDPSAVKQPMLCQQCEAAPCEYVCPVNATLHSDEGLNDMVYNRCVGTRYCSNNCPYKVRRFNFLHYSALKSATEKMAMNPDVTVRGRGVMEKCTFCVQRIERARITARVADRPIRETELVTACQQACPTQVISFGDLLNDQNTVHKKHKDERRYDVLSELGTRPRVAYLAHLTNPNETLTPATAADKALGGGEHN